MAAVHLRSFRPQLCSDIHFRSRIDSKGLREQTPGNYFLKRKNLRHLDVDLEFHSPLWRFLSPRKSHLSIDIYILFDRIGTFWQRTNSVPDLQVGKGNHGSLDCGHHLFDMDVVSEGVLHWLELVSSIRRTTNEKKKMLSCGIRLYSLDVYTNVELAIRTKLH